MKNYKDFLIERRGRLWVIYNLNGQALRTCKTERECKERIDSQTV